MPHNRDNPLTRLGGKNYWMIGKKGGVNLKKNDFW
jgi:hypothetical protein